MLGTLGAWFGQFWLFADVAEIIVYDRVLEDDERNRVQAYIDERYGLPSVGGSR